MQLEVMNSPFSQDQVELLNRLLPNLTEAQQIWLNGYLSALSRSAFASSTASRLAGAPSTNRTIFSIERKSRFERGDRAFWFANGQWTKASRTIKQTTRGAWLPGQLVCHERL